MKKLVVYIVFVSLVLTTLFAGFKYCKKTDKLIPQFSTLVHSANDNNDPVKDASATHFSLCVSFVSINQQLYNIQLQPPVNVVLNHVAFYKGFYTSFATNPPFAPPRFS